MYQRILITGASGRIGRTLAEGLGTQLGPLRLTDIAPFGPTKGDTEFVLADLTSPEQVERLCEGVDAVVHLAGTPNARDWDTTHRLNIQVTQRLFDAAWRAGARRSVYASSLHVFGMYPLDSLLHPDLPVRPDGYYAISKAFGEGVLRYHAEKHGMTGVAVRIGSFRPEPANERELATWLSPADCVRLFHCALGTQVTGYFHPLGFSANSRLRIDDPHATALGYMPKDNGETAASRIPAASKAERTEWRLLGAHMAGRDY